MPLENIVLEKRNAIAYVTGNSYDHDYAKLFR